MKELPQNARNWLSSIGRQGGKRGGKARMKLLTAAQRRELAKKAGRASGKARAAARLKKQKKSAR